MNIEEMSKYEVGQKVWFIAEYPDPVVRRAEIVEKHIYQDERGKTIRLTFKDLDGVHRTAPSSAIYKTKAEASEHLKEVQEKVWLQILGNCELKIGDLKMKIKKYQAELQDVEEEKKKYSEKLNEVRG